MTDGEIPGRGEFALVVGMAGEEIVAAARAAAVGAGPAITMADALATVEGLVQSGIARGEAARRVSAATGLPRRRLYETEARP